MKIKIIRNPDDPQGILRVSAGGLSNEGYYIVYRGNIKDIISCLKYTLDSLEYVQDNEENSVNSIYTHVIPKKYNDN